MEPASHTDTSACACLFNNAVTNTLLLVLEVMLVVLAAIAVPFYSFFVTEAIDLEEITGTRLVALPRVQFHLCFGMLLLATAGAWDVLRRIVEWANRTDKLPCIRDVGTDNEDLLLETPSAAGDAASTSQNTTMVALTDDAYKSSVPVTAAISDDDSAEPPVKAFPLKAKYIWGLTRTGIAFVAFLYLCMAFVYVSGEASDNLAYRIPPKGKIRDQVLQSWGAAYTQSDKTCAFMEAHRCSGGPVLCEYQNVNMHLLRPGAFGSEQCPVCDFTGRREPLVVQSTCVDLIERRAISGDRLYLCLYITALAPHFAVILWFFLQTEVRCLMMLRKLLSQCCK